MTFKSATQPLCRGCGKPIRKWTTTVWVKEQQTQYDHPTNYSRYVYSPAPLKSKADCQRHSNQLVLSVQYSVEFKDGDPVPEMRHVSRFNEWDGETYESEFFCSGTCAQDFGRMAARSGKINSVAYVDALKRQRGEKVT